MPVTIRQVRFRQSGGFGGLVRGCEVAAEDLTAAERRVLGDRAQGGAAEAPARAAGARDLVVYELEVVTDAGTRRLDFDEMSVPSGLEALVDRLVPRAKPMTP